LSQQDLNLGDLGVGNGGVCEGVYEYMCVLSRISFVFLVLWTLV